MSIVVNLDFIRGNSIESTVNHVVINRGVQVTGVPQATPSEMLYLAITASGMPLVGASHPSVTGMYVSRVNLSPIDVDKFEGVITYENLNVAQLQPSSVTPAQMTVGASLQSATTNKDASGALIQVTYNGDTKNCDGINVQVPQVTFRLQRLESSSPQANAIAYVGHVNSTTWNGDAAKTWLMSRIEGTSDNGGVIWTVTYEAVRSNGPDLWKQEVFYTDQSGKIPDDVVAGGNGAAIINLYPTANFNSLSII